MRKFITAEDVYQAAQAGKTELLVQDNDVVTDVARETAARFGLKIVTSETKAVVQAQSVDQVPFTPSPAAYAPRSGEVIRLSSSQPVSIGTVGYEPRTSYAPGVIPTVTQSPFSAAEMAKWRAEFPELADIIHLANCSQGAQSRRVRAAIDKYMENWRLSGMDWDYWVEEVNKAKAVFARFINCKPEDVGVVGSVSEAVSTIASALDYSGNRNRVLLSEAEFPTVGHVWLAHEKYGAKVDYVPLTNGEIRLEDYDRMADDTLLMAAVTHVYYQTGYKQDIKAITDLIHSKGGMVFVDAYQGLGTCPLDVQELGVDVLSTGNLKYLLGVPGIAFMYVRPEIVKHLRPAETGWFGQENPFSFDVKTLDYAKTARRVEGGTPPVTAAFAAIAGMELLLEVGLDKIGQQIDYLSAHCLSEALNRGFDVMSPLDVRKKGATTSLKFAGDIPALEMALKRRNIVTSARGPALRIAPHFFNTTEEIDMCLDQINLILSRQR